MRPLDDRDVKVILACAVALFLAGLAALLLGGCVRKDQADHGYAPAAPPGSFRSGELGSQPRVWTDTNGCQYLVMDGRMIPRMEAESAGMGMRQRGCR